MPGLTGKKPAIGKLVLIPEETKFRPNCQMEEQK
jgi:hypothetical protein